MKRTDHSLELETVEEVEALINAIEKSLAWNRQVKGTDEMRTKSGKILLLIDENYQKVELNPNKIYFLSHPCTTGGGGEKANREAEEEAYQFLVDECKNVKVIRPLKIIPDNYDYSKAMGVCFKQLDISDVTIFSPGFQTSRGCKDEHKYCIENRIPRLYIVAEDVSKVAIIS